jgi:hypothetical protein
MHHRLGSKSRPIAALRVPANTNVFYAIWGSGPTDLYAVGGGASHSTGNGIWSKPSQKVTGSAPVLGIWGSSATDIYAVAGDTGGHTIYHSTGDGDWYSQDSPAAYEMLSIFGIDAQHIYATGANLVAFSAGDGTWTTQVTTTGSGKFHGLWAAGSDAVFACTEDGQLFRSNGKGLWSSGQTIDEKLEASCYAIWGTGVDNIYVGGFGLYHGVP